VNLVLEPSLLEQVVDYTRSVLPLEGCGLLAGRQRTAARFFPITNRLASRTEYDMEPSELIAALRDIRSSGESLLAIVHSHPRGPAVPSPRDVERALYPEAAHVIVSFALPENPEVRGFRIMDGNVVEIELRVIV
jgi:proteasome lid subunit RPN8/RPN11